jgi:CO/xanthine dehydrogenase Mo-binding subunit
MAKLVGTGVPRKEGPEKVTGKARYIDDIHMDGMLYGVTVRSPLPRGRIKGVTFAPGIPWDQIIKVDASDMPGPNYVALITNDQPYLADKVINHREEPILLLAHADKHLLEKARNAVTFDIEPLPAVFDLESSLKRTHVIWGEDNLFKEYKLTKGDVDAAFARHDIIVVEGDYGTGAQEQLYIENNGVIAVATADEVTVWGSLQCPYYVHKALMSLFALPGDKVRVVQCETGGGFGGKEEYPSMLAGHASILARKSGRPVKMIYDRSEDMVATTKRHPSRTRHRTAVLKDGTIVAMDIHFAIDGGAYNTLSPVVLSRGTIHAAGPYKVDNVRIHAQAVATNTPPHGAFRGFGAPQSIFALERHMNKIARRLGMTPEALRSKNFIHTGDTTATHQVVKEHVDMQGLLDRALAEADYHAKREKFARENPTSRVKRGIGFATFMHGSGFTGSGESYLASIVGASGSKDGRVRILAASTEIGQGTNTVFTQIAADALGVRWDDIEIAQPDTANVPNSGPTVASRTTMVVGKLVENAVLGIRQILIDAKLLGERYTPDELRTAVQRHLAEIGPLKATSQYKAPDNLKWDDQSYRGDAYGAYAWAVYVATVAVDTTTYEARVEDFVALQEVGRVIHPVLAAGQIEGGVAQGIGFAVYENVVWKDGRMANGQMTNYIVPTSADVPPIRVFFEEVPYAHGPAGAKGIGELPMDGPAPAIVNAIEDALGREHPALSYVPLMPEQLMHAIDVRRSA